MFEGKGNPSSHDARVNTHFYKKNNDDSYN